MPTIVGGIRRIKGGGRDVAACFASRIESLETDEGGCHAGVGGVFLSAKIGRIQEKNAECGKRNIASLTSRAHDKEEVTKRIYTS